MAFPFSAGEGPPHAREAGLGPFRSLRGWARPLS